MWIGVGLVVVIALVIFLLPRDLERPSGYQAISLDTEVMVSEEGLSYIVDPSKIISGGPPKDGIPSIDEPKFISVEEAKSFLKDHELVLAMTYKGIERVYPLQIMVWHEVVNDWSVGVGLLMRGRLMARLLSLGRRGSCIIVIWLCMIGRRIRIGLRLMGWRLLGLWRGAS
jgi:hypothetical protein